MTVRSEATLDFYNLVDGINTVSSAVRLKLSEARDIQNMDLFPIGGCSKRNGYANIVEVVAGVDSDPITGIYMARYSNDTVRFYSVRGAVLNRRTQAFGSSTDITGALTITAGADNIWNFAMLNDIVVMGNGNTDASIQISSAGSASALTPGPFTKFLFPVESRGYMWYFAPTVGGTVQEDRGYFSEINDPTTVGSNSFVNVAKGQGGGVRGAVDYKTYLYVFKRHGIYQLTYQPTRVNSSGTIFPWTEYPNPIVPGVGTLSHRSIVKFTTPSTHATPGQELVFFVDQFGVPRIFDGTTTISFSSKIGSSRDTNILSLANMTKTRTPYCFAINYPSKNRILCFMSRLNSQNDTVWVLDYNIGFAFSRYKYARAFNCGSLVEKSDGTFKPYVGDYVGNVFQLDQGTTDDGQPIDDYYVTGDTFNRSPSIVSKWHEAEFRGTQSGNSQRATIEYYANGGDTPYADDEIGLSENQTEWSDPLDSSPSMIWGTSYWAKQGLTAKTSEINNPSKTLRLKIGSTDKTNDSLTLEGWSVTAEPLGTAQN